MTYLEALDVLDARNDVAIKRLRELCADTNRDSEQREAYRRLVIKKASTVPVERPVVKVALSGRTVSASVQWSPDDAPRGRPCGSC